MARAVLTSPRVLRTGKPLSMAQILSVAPAVGALQPHDSRGPRYAYVPTIQPLQTLLDNGWGVFEASQQRSRTAEKDPYTKHMLRLRKLDAFAGNTWQEIPEVVLINAHDGTAAYNLFGGVFRFICSNGLIVGSTLAAFKVRHTVGPQTSLEVLRAGEAIVTEQFPKVLERIEVFKSTPIKLDQSMRLAAVGMQLRYGDTMAPFPTEDLLNFRRDEDRDPTLWNMLNRIQENILEGGWETRSAMFGRRSTVKSVERVTAVAKINRGLWDEAEDIAAEVA